ncbi:MAG: ABC transporter permease [Acidobacteriota bacterium]
MDKAPPGLVEHVLGLARKEALHVLRSRRELALILAMPGVLTFLFGYAFEVGQVKDVRTAVVDEDGSALSQRIVAAIGRDDVFSEVPAALSPSKARQAMDRDRFLVVIRIPEGTQRIARSTGRAPIEVKLSGIDTNSAPAALRALTRIVMEENAKLLALRLGRLGLDGEDLETTLRPLDLDAEVLYNPTFRFINYVMPGIIGLILQLLTVGLMAGSLTREKELGTFEAILASPVRPLALLLGKTLPYAVVSLFEVATVLSIARYGFSVSLGPRLLPALVLAVLFVLATLATGLLISTLTHTQAQSLQVTVFYTLPAFMLSGALAPLNVMPENVRVVSWLFPLTYFCRGFRDVSLKGLALPDVWRDATLLLVYSFAAIAAARALIRKRLE